MRMMMIMRKRRRRRRSRVATNIRNVSMTVWG